MAKKPKFNRIEVDSSNIKSIAHDGKATMEVVFKNRSNDRPVAYTYYPVSPEAFEEFKAAESKGEWFHKNIRGNDSITAEKS